MNEVLLERFGSVAVVTMNRPQVRNALSSSLLQALTTALEEVAADDDVGCVVLTGAGTSFCAGLDLTEVEVGHQALEGRDNIVQVVAAIAKPVIGAVNGPAVTGGLELALACDFLIGSSSACFADTHARIGVMPGWGMAFRLPEVVGLRFAKQMSFTGNYVSAREALRVGLLNEVVESDELLSRAVALAQDVASCRGRVQRGMHSVYADIASLGENSGQVIEQRAHQHFTSDFDGRSIAERRMEVIERGRAQLS